MESVQPVALAEFRAARCGWLFTFLCSCPSITRLCRFVLGAFLASQGLKSTSVSPMAIISKSFLGVALLASCVLVQVSIATSRGSCSTPRLLTWDNLNCDGTPDSGPLLEPNVCPGTCATVSPPTATPSFMYKCGSDGLDMRNSYRSNCSGPYFSAKIATGRCLSLFGHSLATTCQSNDPVLPPLTPSSQPTNGTIMPSFPCPQPYRCTPGVPFKTHYTSLNCMGRASSSEIFARNRLNSCYGDFFLGFQLHMTCDAGLINFNWFDAGCANPAFLNISWPTNVCINDLDSEESFVMNCGSREAGKNAGQAPGDGHISQPTISYKPTGVLPRLFPGLFPAALVPLL